MKKKASYPMGEERVYPNDGQDLAWKGEVLREAGRYKEAITALEHAIRLNLDDERG